MQRFAEVALALALACAAAPWAIAQCESGAAERDLPRARETLAEAMKHRDRPAIEDAIERLQCIWSGAPPEKPERYARVEGIEHPMSRTEAVAELGGYFTSIAPKLWWETRDLPPPEIPQPLRVPAEIVHASLALWRLTDRRDTEALLRARRAGDYLLQAQREAGTGVFGFPAWRGREGLGVVVDRLRAEAVEQGNASTLEANGWIVNDFGDGGLYFDNGLAGEALIELHRATGDARHLDAARRAAEWAIARPIVPNFNYNGFTVLLLSRLYEVTNDRRYLDEAVERAELGMLSGQVEAGAERGSWIDPHNKRIVYRFIMIRQLAALLAAMPAAHPQRATIQSSVLTALNSVEDQMRRNGGIGNVNSAVLAYCDLDRSFAEADWLHRRRDLEQALMTYSIRAIRSGKVESDPAAVACVLETQSRSP